MTEEFVIVIVVADVDVKELNIVAENSRDDVGNENGIETAENGTRFLVVAIVVVVARSPLLVVNANVGVLMLLLLRLMVVFARGTIGDNDDDDEAKLIFEAITVDAA